MVIKRGDVLLVDFGSGRGSEQAKTRPCVVVQNDIGNRYSNTTIVVPITSRVREKDYPTDVFATGKELSLPRDGSVNCSQIMTFSVRHRAKKKLGSLKPGTMGRVDDALRASLSL